MIFLDNQTNIDIELKTLRDIANYLGIDKDIELIFVDDNKMRAINKEYRSIDNTTDVLSFPLAEVEHLPLGSIIISIDKAKEVANRLKHSLDSEIALLFTHGLLHLLGYDHEVDNGEMRKREEEIIDAFKLPKSLIIRTKGV